MLGKAIVRMTDVGALTTTEHLIDEATLSAKRFLGFENREDLDGYETAQVDFFAMQALIGLGKKTEAAIAQYALDICRRQAWTALGMGSFEEFWSALGTESDSGVPTVELSDRCKSILGIMVPKLLVPLDAMRGRDGLPEVSKFLNGKWSTAVEITPLVRTLDLDDPDDMKTWTYWVKRAAEANPKDLRREMQSAGVKATRGPQIDLIPCLTQLEGSYLDPRTGKKVKGTTVIMTFYMTDPKQEGLLRNRMEGYIDEVRDATPKGKGRGK